MQESGMAYNYYYYYNDYSIMKYAKIVEILSFYTNQKESDFISKE